jgi:hypothetical protein
MSRKKKVKKKSKPIIQKKQDPIVETPKAEINIRKGEKYLPYIILFIIPFLIYGYSVSFDYVLDDKIVFSENNFVKNGLDGIKDIFTTESFTGYFGEQKDLVVGGRYRPLSLVTYAVEYEFFRLNPKVSHFINILLYALTGLLLYRILSLFFKRNNRRWYIAIPFIAALLFILHPIHTEVVSNVKSRDEILALLFSLAVLYYTYRYTINEKKYFLIVSPLLFLLALLAKENALTFLAVIPLTIYFFSKASLKKITVLFVPLLASAVVFIFIRYQVIGYFLDSGKEVTGLMNNPFLGVDPADKFATIFYTLGLYLKLLVFPHPLTHDYYPYQIPIVQWGNIKVIISILIYIIMGVYAVMTIRKKNVTSWAILYFLITLSIVSNLVFSIGTFMNERFMYMPSIGFVVLLSYWLLVKLPGLTKKNPGVYKAMGLALLFICITGYTYKTIDRVPAWKNALTLNRAASKVSVNSARANQFMGYSLYVEANAAKDREEKRKLLDEATYYIDRAITIHPTYPDANNAKAGLLAAYYGLDRNLDTLLEGFYSLQTKRLIPFIDTYLDYLDNRADKAKMAAFYRRLGTDLIKRGVTWKGNYYLQKAL